ncbi:MAG: hypothetical protein INR67_13525, partial [Jatrophihabitans endophyticus]
MTIAKRTRRFRVAATAVALALAASGCGAASTTVAGHPSAAQYPPRATRIATLKKVEKRITAREAKHPYYGDIRVKDLRSFGVDALWNKGIDGAGTSVAVI